ncbi:MAG: sugar-binding protein, partial [Pseudomonadota bacterium]
RALGSILPRAGGNLLNEFPYGPLADFTEIVTPGVTVLNVLNYNNTGERFDADGDGRSNLSEAIDNRNLLSQFDLEVPLLNSFGGPVAQITDDGVDGDTSGGGQIETDENSTFRLRHTGSELIVNVCGNDQTLIGDNSAEGGNGQYWHDDTVFLYIDGSDNDSQTYDQVDDFQFAFVRSTEAFIVSKAPPQFCPTNDCVEFSFFQNSTECEYELSVTLPLNDLNIALDSPVGFDVEIVDDDDGDLREGSSAWIGFNDQSNLDPSTFGTIRLN